MMTDQEFTALVRSLRDAQIIYFRTHDWTDLRYARDFERRVDRELAERTKAQQPQQGRHL